MGLTFARAPAPHGIYWCHAMPLAQVLLFGEYAWNKTADDTKDLPSGVTRVKDWEQVLSVIDTLDLK